MNRLFLLFMCLASTNLAFGQDEVIPLWPNGTPNLVNRTQQEVVEMKNGKIDKIKKVVKPEIAVYKPKGTSTGTTIIICPGGGYNFLSYTNEGTEIAEWLSGLGITAVILKYRLPDKKLFKNSSEVPLMDALQAIKLVRSKASSWQIDPDKVGIIGFSAGGHVAASASTLYTSSAVRPDFSILIYPVITMDQSFTHPWSRSTLIGNNPNSDKIQRFSLEQHVTKDTPPAFVLHSNDDAFVPSQNSTEYHNALVKNGLDKSELHLMPNGGHGYGLAKFKKGKLSTWPKLCENWLSSNGWL